MEIWVYSIIAGLSIGFVFLLIAKFSKQEDYLLDDYTEDESPDNVRVIEREVPKIVEKEVIVEVERLIQDDAEIIRLNQELESLKDKLSISNSDINLLTTQKTELYSKISTQDSEKSRLESEISMKDSEITRTTKTIEDTELIFNSFKEESTKKYQEVSSKYQEVIGERDTLVIEKDNLVTEKDNLVTEKDSLSTEKEKLSEENELSKKSLEQIELDKTETVSRLNKDKEKLKEKLEKVEENRKEYQSLFEKSKESVGRAIRDRDHFIGLVDQKDIEIIKMKKDVISNPHVFEGTDEYGKFNDVYNLGGSFDKKLSQRIIEINDNLESGQFAYYVLNNVAETENVQINDIENLDKFLKIVNQQETTGKYKVYLIFSNKVYPFKIH